MFPAFACSWPPLRRSLFRIWKRQFSDRWHGSATTNRIPIDFGWLTMMSCPISLPTLCRRSMNWCLFSMMKSLQHTAAHRTEFLIGLWSFFDLIFFWICSILYHWIGIWGLKLKTNKNWKRMQPWWTIDQSWPWLLVFNIQFVHFCVVCGSCESITGKSSIEHLQIARFEEMTDCLLRLNLSKTSISINCFLFCFCVVRIRGY